MKGRRIFQFEDENVSHDDDGIHYQQQTEDHYIPNDKLSIANEIRWKISNTVEAALCDHG